MIPIYELENLSGFTTERLEAEQREAILSIGKIKQKIHKLPTGKELVIRNLVGPKRDMVAAKMAYATVYQMTSLELGKRRQKQREERSKCVETMFVSLAKARLPEDVFQDLLDEAVDKTREGE